MARLSRFFGWRDPAGTDPAEVVCRPIERAEIESALRLILADDSGLAGDEAVLDFLAYAVQRQIDLNQIWVAAVGDRIEWALLPMASPGRTMLMLTPPAMFRGTSVAAVRKLVQTVCERWGREGVQLAQFLLPPGDSTVRQTYLSCGFEMLAELVYLQRASTGSLQEVGLPAGYELHNYDGSTHRGFVEGIRQSYEGSFDCPSLNGLRNMEDVIAGHKGTGAFDPSAWHLMTTAGQPRGVLILSPAPHNELLELVYLGLSPESRGKGLGNVLMRVAMNEVKRLDRSELSLAVDSRNEPAMKLYFRHGLRRVGSRLALLRDLRPSVPAPH